MCEQSWSCDAGQSRSTDESAGKTFQMQWVTCKGGQPASYPKARSPRPCLPCGDTALPASLRRSVGSGCAAQDPAAHGVRAAEARGAPKPHFGRRRQTFLARGAQLPRQLQARDGESAAAVPQPRPEDRGGAGRGGWGKLSRRACRLLTCLRSAASVRAPSMSSANTARRFGFVVSLSKSLTATCSPDGSKVPRKTSQLAPLPMRVARFEASYRTSGMAGVGDVEAPQPMS